MAAQRCPLKYPVSQPMSIAGTMTQATDARNRIEMPAIWGLL